jgi:hypothetical protein
MAAIFMPRMISRIPLSRTAVPLKIINNTGEVVMTTGSKTITILQGETLELRWNGTEWRVKTNYLVGDMIEQFPSERSPEEKMFEGTWVNWSSRAVLYGLISTYPSSTRGAYVGSMAYAVNNYVTFQYPGGDLQLLQCTVDHTSDTLADRPAPDPVKWKLVSTKYDTRQACGNLLTATDYTLGTRITSGVNQNLYVTEKIVPGGKFFGIEGGFRPTFISGGRQDDRIREIYGNPESETSGASTSESTGAFETVHSQPSGYGTLGYSKHVIFKASRVVKTGPDVAGTNVSARLWRRTS